MGAAAALQVPPVAPIAVRNILFATDFSATSSAALPFALALAKRYGAALFVTHILPPEPEADAISARQQEAQARFDALLASGVLNPVVHEPILRCGNFWEAMQDVIATRAIDMIVAGTHGRQGVRKILLGSVAEIIFRHAACPVFTIGPQAQYSGGPLASVIFATDFSPASLDAFPYAYSLAEKEGAQLTMVHAVQPAPPVADAVVMPVGEMDLAEEARQRMNEMLLAYPPLRTKPEVVTMTGEAAEAVLYVASQRKYVLRKADVIVMGVRAKSAAATHFPWSIADAVVCRAQCPVLTVRGGN